jgi:hypothetical protein
VLRGGVGRDRLLDLGWLDTVFADVVRIPIFAVPIEQEAPPFM